MSNCDLEEAMRREAGRPEGLVMADLYAKALKRRRTGEQFEGLGEVIGVDVEFEVDPGAEFIIDNTTPAQGRDPEKDAALSGHLARQ